MPLNPVLIQGLDEVPPPEEPSSLSISLLGLQGSSFSQIMKGMQTRSQKWEWREE